MVIYNETYIVNPEIGEVWLSWIKQHHIPAVLNTGYFDTYKILTVLNSPNEGLTYCIQFNTGAIEEYTRFSEEHLQQLHILHNQMFENQFVLFNTVMQLIEESAT